MQKGEKGRSDVGADGVQNDSRELGAYHTISQEELFQKKVSQSLSE